MKQTQKTSAACQVIEMVGKHSEFAYSTVYISLLSLTIVAFNVTGMPVSDLLVESQLFCL